MTYLFEISNLSASYNGTLVLEKVNLKVRENDFIGIIGPNGGGKTTLLKVILGLIKPVEGKIVFNKDLVDYSNIGYLPQISGGDTSFPVSVRDVIMSGLMNKKGVSGRMTKGDNLKADKIIERLGIRKLAKAKLSEMSGGELQRVYLGRALIASPKLLLLDEPGNFVDSSFEQDFYDMLREVNGTVTILMVSHDVGTISAYVKSFACVNRSLHYHDSEKITSDQLESYGCPIQLIAHGDIPHTVLKKH